VNESCSCLPQASSSALARSFVRFSHPPSKLKPSRCIFGLRLHRTCQDGDAAGSSSWQAAPSAADRPAQGPGGDDAPVAGEAAARHIRAKGEARRRRAGDDGWPRLYHPNGAGYIRLSGNQRGYWDMRAVCSICHSTLSRTCQAPPVSTRAGTKLHGQGRPLGKLWAWLSQGKDLGTAHTSEQHKLVRPSLADRERGRAEAASQEEAVQWLASERPRDDRDTAAGEPRDLP
jgi:hypothetical protein